VAEWLVVTAQPDPAQRGIELATEALGFVYPDGTRALSDVTLKVPAGSTVAIIGQNGSGKSTLVRHFNGLLRATEGQVLVAGAAVGKAHVAQLARLVGISFQNPDRQIFSANASTEVAFGPHNLGLKGRDLERRVVRALTQVGLGELAEVNPYDLGFSERKLLALASVIAMDTPAIVLDEPTTGQDANGVERVKRIVGELASEGRTVVAISHDMTFVAETFERVIVMRAGRIAFDGSVDDAFAEENWATLESTFLEPPLPARLGARLALGSTPTARAFVSALAQRGPSDTMPSEGTGSG
jgi:energy-coupling factor transport system ATP-binding protein